LSFYPESLASPFWKYGIMLGTLTSPLKIGASDKGQGAREEEREQKK